MKRLPTCVVAVLFVSALIPFPGIATVAEQQVSLDSIRFATAVESREPVGVSLEFDSSVVQVYCWTRLSTKTPPAKVKHVWYKAGQKVLEVPLTLNYSSGRYWSVKNVSAGDWTVEVTGANDEVIGAASFKVK